MSFKIVSFFENFSDIDGDPLDAGYIYVGQYGLNPEASPLQVYYDKSLSIPASQPIRTVNGYPSRAGSIAAMYVGLSQYSITVRNRNGSLIYSELYVDEGAESAWQGARAAIYLSPTSYRYQNVDRTGELSVGQMVKMEGGADRYGKIESFTFVTHTDVVVSNVRDSSNAASTVNAGMTSASLSIQSLGAGGSIVPWYPVESWESGVVDTSYPTYVAERYGWSGDGSTDNGDPQAVLDAISTNGGGEIIFGQGRWLFDEFEVPEGVILVGVGPNHEAIAGDKGTILDINESQSGDCISFARDTSSCGLRNLSVLVRGTSAVNAIVRTQGTLRPVIDNMEAEYDGANNPGRRSVSVSGAADNGSGLIRITATNHGFLTGNIVDIEGVTGTTEANGAWRVTYVDANNFDLQGSSFASAFVSGGTAYSLGAGLLIDRGTSFETLYASVDIKSHSANSGLVLFDDSNAIGISPASSLQGKYIALRLLGQSSFNTGFSCTGAIEGAYNSGMKHEFVANGLGIVDAIAPVDLYVVVLAQIEVGEGVSFPGGYFELAGAPATYDDGVNGTHNLYPVVRIGASARGVFSRASLRTRLLDLGRDTDFNSTSYKSHDTRAIPRLVARTNAAQAVAAFSNVPIDFSTQLLENDVTTFGVSGSTITVHQDGTYRLSACTRLQALTAATNYLYLRANMGGTIFQGENHVEAIGKEPGSNITCVLTLSAGDTIEVSMFQAAGAESLSANLEQNYLCIERC